MLKRFFTIAALGLALAPSLGATVQAQEAFPSRPITLIVPWGPGGGADRLGRVSSKLMEPLLKVSLPVVNMPGASGQTGLTKLVTSVPDGYTVEILTADTFAQFVAENARFKTDQITPLGIMIQQPSGFFVKADSPWKTWDDVAKAAKDKPLKVAITGFGSPDDLTVRYLRSKGLQLDSVPFAEPGLRYSSLIGGQSDLLYEQAGDVRSFLDGKQMRPVLFFGSQKFEPYPEVAFSKQIGLDVTLPQFRAMIVKSGTEPAKVKALGEALAKIASDPEYKAYLEQQMGDPNSFVMADGAQKFFADWVQEATGLLKTVSGKNP